MPLTPRTIIHILMSMKWPLTTDCTRKGNPTQEHDRPPTNKGLTDTIVTRVIDWQTRPLCFRYEVLLLDALRVEIQEGGVARDKTIHLALGMHAESEPEVLDLRLEQNADGFPFWLEICQQLKCRGVEHIRIVMADGPAWPKGLPEAFQATFPATKLQASPVPTIRLSLSEATQRDRKPLAAALRPIHAAASAAAAQVALKALVAGPWGAKYPSIAKRWQAAWQPLLPLFALPRKVRRLALEAVDTTETLHLRLSRAIDRHGPFAGDREATMFVWLALRHPMGRRASHEARVEVGANHPFTPDKPSDSRPTMEVSSR
jgi:putative transposase